MNRVLAVIMFAALVSCGATTQKVITPKTGVQADCLKLLEQRDDAALAGKILAGVGSISALVTPPIEMEDERTEKNARWGVGAAAATTGIVGVALIWWSETKGREFETLCEVREIPLMPTDQTDADSGASPIP